MSKALVSADHAKKYRTFLDLIEASKANDVEAVILANARMLGDTYEELLTNLDLLAEAGLSLSLVRVTEPVVSRTAP
jgi:hypothetical protein